MVSNNFRNENLLSKTPGKECSQCKNICIFPKYCDPHPETRFLLVKTFNSLVRFFALKCTQEEKSGKWALILWESKFLSYFFCLYYFKLLKELFLYKVFLSQNTIGMSAKTQQLAFSKSLLQNFIMP